MNNRTMTRADFLKNGFKTLFDKTTEALDHQVEEKARKMVVPLHRPPGAIEEILFLSTCERCNTCIEACPHEAIVRAEAKYGAAIGTPMIKPYDTPCYMCEDLPCVRACPGEALLPVKEIEMGTAHIIHNKCFAHNGQICDYCFDRCPLKGEAIVMENRKPRVIEENCTGCGLCEYFCPAPGNAIKVLPER